MLFGSAPAAGVAGADAVGENTFLSPSFSVLFSISIEPLKYAPSSMMICTVVKFPFTEPSFLISILPFPWTLPFTLPYTILASNDVGCQLCCSSDCQLPLIELDQSFNCSVNVQVLVARDFAFHMQARSDPRCRAVRCRSAGRITSLFILVVPSQGAGVR